MAKKKQFELNNADIELLNSYQYSNEGWELIGMKYGIDPESRELLKGTHGRAFIAFPKIWPKKERPKRGVLTAEGTKLYNQGELRQMTQTSKGQEVITTPINDDVTFE